MTREEIVDMIRDRTRNLEDVIFKLEKDWALEDSDEFCRLCKRRTELKQEIENLENGLAIY